MSQQFRTIKLEIRTWHDCNRRRPRRAAVGLGQMSEMGCRSGVVLVALVLRGLSRAERNAASVRCEGRSAGAKLT